MTPWRAVGRRAPLPAVLAGVAMAAALAGCGDDGPPVAREDPNDPVTVLCRAPSEDARSACSSSYFACHGKARQIIDEDDLPRDSSRARVLRDYVETNWREWEPRIQAAAAKGCRAGLRDRGGPA